MSLKDVNDDYLNRPGTKVPGTSLDTVGLLPFVGDQAHFWAIFRQSSGRKGPFSSHFWGPIP